MRGYNYKIQDGKLYIDGKEIQGGEEEIVIINEQEIKIKDLPEGFIAKGSYDA